MRGVTSRTSTHARVLIDGVKTIDARIGRLQVDAISHGDVTIIQGTVLVAAIFIILANILVDIAYAFLDPRVRYS